MPQSIDWWKIEFWSMLIPFSAPLLCVCFSEEPGVSSWSRVCLSFYHHSIRIDDLWILNKLTSWKNKLCRKLTSSRHGCHFLTWKCDRWLGWNQSKQKGQKWTNGWMDESRNGWRSWLPAGEVVMGHRINEMSVKWTELWGRWATENGGSLWVYDFRKLSNTSYLRWTLAPSVCCKVNGSKQTAVIPHPTSRWTNDFFFTVPHNQCGTFPAG